MSSLIERIASDEILEQAFQWLCKKRNHYHFNADVWQLRRSWMDDWVILAPTRWKLRHAVKIVNRVLNQLMVVKHPDKTFIGRISKGFDFLGYWFSTSGISIAAKSNKRMLQRSLRLYEQGADVFGIDIYLLRAIGWFVLGLSRVFFVLRLSRLSRLSCVAILWTLIIFIGQQLPISFCQLCANIYYRWL